MAVCDFTSHNTNSITHTNITAILMQGQEAAYRIGACPLLSLIDETKLASIQLTVLNAILRSNNVDSDTGKLIRACRKKVKGRYSKRGLRSKNRAKDNDEEKQIGILISVRKMLRNERVKLLEEIFEYKRHLSASSCAVAGIENYRTFEFRFNM